MKKCTRRYSLILEVLIAFAIIVLCILPLLYPHVGVLRAQQEMMTTVQLDHLVNLLYGKTVEKMYLNEIPWSTFHSDKPIPIDAEMIKAVGIKEEIPYKGSYRFVEVKHKPKKLEPGDKALYLYKIIYEFVPLNKKKTNNKDEENKKNKTYEYQFVAQKNSH